MGELKEIVDKWVAGELTDAALAETALNFDDFKGIALLKLAKARNPKSFYMRWYRERNVSKELMDKVVERYMPYLFEEGTPVITKRKELPVEVEEWMKQNGGDIDGRAEGD